MILFTIINEKEQVINLRQKFLHSADTFYNNKRKGTSNKFASEISLFF